MEVQPRHAQYRSELKIPHSNKKPSAQSSARHSKQSSTIPTPKGKRERRFSNQSRQTTRSEQTDASDKRTITNEHFDGIVERLYGMYRKYNEKKESRRYLSHQEEQFKISHKPQMNQKSRKIIESKQIKTKEGVIVSKAQPIFNSNRIN